MALLFGGRGNQGRSQPKNIVEFRAGKMTLKGNMVHPDKRKGQVYVYQSEDQLTHFCWKDRTSGVVEDDLIIFPEDAVFSKVNQCKDGDRVVLLKFKASSRKLFFWMQEPKADNDEELVGKVNEALNNPGGVSSGRGLDNSSTPSEQEMQNLLQSMNQSQLMELIGGMSGYGGQAAAGLLAQLTQAAGGGGSSGQSSESKPAADTSTGSTNSSSTPKSTKPDQASAPAKPAPAATAVPGSSAGRVVQLEDLQKILSGMQPNTASVDLAAGVNTEFVKRITASPTTVQKLTPLLPRFGYESEKTANQDEVVDTLISPAFQHALSSFCSAFPSGQLGPLVEQFEFGTDAVQAARSGNLEAFLNAIQKEADSKKTSDTTEEQKPEDMNVD
ncbi:Proteasomal ubiquitin receptor ADRM1 [Orchesella cincta]|uniref:Proteasomal ubiquitin receptor ADRM1 homolog n=1 Tax=Orchesella cincta TaxID=48709 RepID=A0A1D2N8C8_ORCCI|nr:Proteasomal ubiquitin receptor ADRM1 [Orchesella cincta]